MTQPARTQDELRWNECAECGHPLEKCSCYVISEESPSFEDEVALWCLVCGLPATQCKCEDAE